MAENRQTHNAGRTGIRVVLFDYGGVLAEEGFREGLFSIARQQGLEPDVFYQTAQQGVYDSGFVSGNGTEADFWRYMRERFPLHGDDELLSTEILQRFVLRPYMLELVRTIRISYRLGKGKRDASLFDDVAADLDLSPARIVFIDDNHGNIERACSRGMNGVEFTSDKECLVRLEAMLDQSLHNAT
jgi:putative hydrolase of the HAD superfamily